MKETDSLKQVFVKEMQFANDNLVKKADSLLLPYKFPKKIKKEDLLTKLSATDKTKYQLLKDEQQLIIKQNKAKEEEYSNFYNEKVGKIVDKINQVVNTYCVANKIEGLLKIDVLSQAVAYYDEKSDVTLQIISKLQK